MRQSFQKYVLMIALHMSIGFTVHENSVGQGRLHSAERNGICKMRNGMESVYCGTVKRGMTECGTTEICKMRNADRRKSVKCGMRTAGICIRRNGMESANCGTEWNLYIAESVKRGMAECGPPESVKCGMRTAGICIWRNINIF